MKKIFLKHKDNCKSKNDTLLNKNEVDTLNKKIDKINGNLSGDGFVQGAAGRECRSGCVRCSTGLRHNRIVRH